MNTEITFDTLSANAELLLPSITVKAQDVEVEVDEFVDKKDDTIAYYGRSKDTEFVVRFHNIGDDTPSVHKHPVTVSCNDMSYMYYFANANAEKGVQEGERIEVPIPKGPAPGKKAQAPKNPDNLPGVCKHIYAFVSMLMVQGKIEG